ncbi:MAG: hypothetical protein KatS3mg052_1746 [Candidatus Roseilinea sp.]|nr:MAG: hypothetical protein KatS3mg052_1746 [Candidatus Roseilinea sp.]
MSSSSPKAIGLPALVVCGRMELTTPATTTLCPLSPSVNEALVCVICC